MNFQKQHYLIIWTVAGFLIGASIFYYAVIQSDISAANIEVQKFNTLSPWLQQETSSWELTYTLPNGLILFDTTIPAWWEFDYESDKSITKFVSANIPVHNKQYTPSDLVLIDSEWLVVNNAHMKLRATALDKLDILAQEFYTIFHDKIVIVSAYRSYGYQVNLAKGCATTLCARAWYSEHQLGLTIDIFAATTAWKFLSKAEFKKYYERLMQNAHRYGWHNSYQKGVAIDTYQLEPWHWRYVGRELATELYDNQMSFAQWYTQQKIWDIVITWNNLILTGVVL